MKPSLAVMIGMPRRGGGSGTAKDGEGERNSEGGDDLGRALLDAIRDDDATGVAAAVRAICESGEE